MYELDKANIQRQQLFVLDTFSCHVENGHNADFEFCSDPTCQRALVVERELVASGYMELTWEHRQHAAKPPTRKQLEADALARDEAAQRSLDAELGIAFNRQEDSNG